MNGTVEIRTQVLFSDHHSFLVLIIFKICYNNEYCSRNFLISTFQMFPFNLSLLVPIPLFTIYTWSVLKILSCILFPLWSFITNLILLLSLCHRYFSFVFLKLLYFTYLQNYLFSPFKLNSVFSIVFHQGLSHGILFQLTIS